MYVFTHFYEREKHTLTIYERRTRRGARTYYFLLYLLIHYVVKKMEFVGADQ